MEKPIGPKPDRAIGVKADHSRWVGRLVGWDEAGPKSKAWNPEAKIRPREVIKIQCETPESKVVVSGIQSNTEKSRIHERAVSEDPQWSFDASPYFVWNPEPLYPPESDSMTLTIQRAAHVLRNPEGFSCSPESRTKKSIPESHWTKSAHSGFEAQIQSFIARNPEEAIIFGFQRFCVGFGVENPKTKTMFYDRSNPQILSL